MEQWLREPQSPQQQMAKRLMTRMMPSMRQPQTSLEIGWPSTRPSWLKKKK